MAQNIKKLISEPEIFADQVAKSVVENIGHTAPVAKLRKSQILTGILGASGLALFLVGVEKVFSPLSGWFSILLGLTFLVISGAIYTKL